MRLKQPDKRALHCRELSAILIGIDRFARLLGGDVTVASRVGMGTTFLLTLPMKAPAGATIRRRDTPTTPTGPVRALHI